MASSINDDPWSRDESIEDRENRYKELWISYKAAVPTPHTTDSYSYFPFIDSGMRRMLADWILDVCDQIHKYNSWISVRLVYIHTIQFVDQYMQEHPTFTRDHFQIMGYGAIQASFIKLHGYGLFGDSNYFYQVMSPLFSQERIEYWRDQLLNTQCESFIPALDILTCWFNITDQHLTRTLDYLTSATFNVELAYKTDPSLLLPSIIYTSWESAGVGRTDLFGSYAHDDEWGERFLSKLSLERASVEKIQTVLFQEIRLHQTLHLFSDIIATHHTDQSDSIRQPEFMSFVVPISDETSEAESAGHDGEDTQADDTDSDAGSDNDSETGYLPQTSEDFFEEVKKLMQCPITLSTFHNPAIAADGHIYEYSWIKEWLRNSDRSPITQKPMDSTLVKCPILKSIAYMVRNEFIKHPASQEEK